jgi:DNA replication and repair protein RecF
MANAHHAELSQGGEQLHLQYLPSFNPGHLSEVEFGQLDDERRAPLLAERAQPELSTHTVATHYRHKVQQRRMRELDSGTTLYGPHRDDFRFLVNGRDLRLYGSRGQQRSAALALKLAEVRAMTTRTGSAPVLLLDDVMSELDAARRAMLLTTLEGVNQAVLTTTDWDDFSPALRARARRLHVQGGAVFEAPSEESGPA